MRKYIYRLEERVNLLFLLLSPDIKKLAKDTFKTMEGAILNNPRPLKFEYIERLYRESL